MELINQVIVPVCLGFGIGHFIYLGMVECRFWLFIAGLFIVGAISHLITLGVK